MPLEPVKLPNASLENYVMMHEYHFIFITIVLKLKLYTLKDSNCYEIGVLVTVRVHNRIKPGHTPVQKCFLLKQLPIGYIAKLYY